MDAITRKAERDAALIHNGLTRVYYASEPIVAGRPLRWFGKITPPRRTWWQALAAMF